MPHRRTFLKTLAGVGLAAASAGRVAGANERVRVGIIGVGLIGSRHLLDCLGQPDVEVAAICEVCEPRLAQGVALAGGRPDRYKDFRQLLDRTDIDAVVVSTPDHWHALMTILACNAGKDVYVEKPLTLFAREGTWMLKAARHHRRIVQVGTQQRSGAHYQRCAELVRNGHIGDLRNARVGAFRNILPGFTKPVDERPLSEAEWDLWLGPAPYMPFDARRGLYHFRWFWDYSGGQTTNLLFHDLDIVQWFTGAMPRSVAAMAQRRSLEGFGETPDGFEAIFEYPGFLANWSNREVAAGRRGGLELYGTKGMLMLNRGGFEVVPDPDLAPEDQIPRFSGPGPAPARQPVTRVRTTALKEEGFEQIRDQFVPHVRNFVDGVKSRSEPISDLASSHGTALSCHLANIAARVGRVIRWDTERDDVIGDAEASGLLTRPYRAPWDRELEAALPRS
jgi:predicted dehydrogenase